MGKCFGFCHSLVDIRASARAGVCGSEREYEGVSADRRGSEHGNLQEKDKNQYFCTNLGYIHLEIMNELEIPK